jgi:hypothetical protein
MRAQLPDGYPAASQILFEMSNDLNELREPTLNLIARLFTCRPFCDQMRDAARPYVERGARRGRGGGSEGGGGGEPAAGEARGCGGWVAERLRVEADGRVPGTGGFAWLPSAWFLMHAWALVCIFPCLQHPCINYPTAQPSTVNRPPDEKLRIIVLRPGEWDDLAANVARIAASQQVGLLHNIDPNRPQQPTPTDSSQPPPTVNRQPPPQMRDKAFGSFMAWLSRHGPFQIIVDGCNVSKHTVNAEAAAAAAKAAGLHVGSATGGGGSGGAAAGGKANPTAAAAAGGGGEGGEQAAGGASSDGGTSGGCAEKAAAAAAAELADPDGNIQHLMGMQTVLQRDAPGKRVLFVLHR